MNSFISASNPSCPDWPAFLRAFALAFALVLATLYFLLVALDPYGTGRFAWAAKLLGTPAATELTGRGRDPTFNSAIVGNSRIQLIRPAQLNEQTGLDFVSLISHGTYPTEQFITLDWFLRHHAMPKAIVLGLDETWCFNPAGSTNRFPRWLYKDDKTYLLGLFRFETIKVALRSIEVLIGWSAYSRDGFGDYEDAYKALGLDDMRIVRQKQATPRPTVPYTSEGELPVADQLQAVLARLPSSTAVILAWPPQHINVIEVPGSRAAAVLKYCRDRFAKIAHERGRAAIVDWTSERPLSSVDENFLDRVHYRSNVATEFGEDIAAALNRITP